MKWLIPALLLISTAGWAREGDLLTHYERSGHRRTPDYPETIAYCKRLATSSPWIRYLSFGTSPQGRDLPLLIADRDGQFLPEERRDGDKIVLLIQAGIHSGESDGKEAGFILLRELAATRERAELLDHITVLFIPIFNVDGYERYGAYNRINQNGPEQTGWRTTAQNLNLNRDYLKSDAPETQAWLRLFNQWLPDFFIDCHATDGADYQYIITYLAEVHGNMAPSLTRWTRDTYIETIKQTMVRSGYTLFPYVYLMEWPNPRSGIKSWVATPRFAQGYTAIRNRPGILIETHMVKDYKTRVTAVYEMLKQTMALLNEEYVNLKDAIEDAEAFTASEAFRREPFAVGFTESRDATSIEFEGVGFTAEKSDLTRGTWYKFTGEPETFEIPYYDKQEPTVLVDLPEAYIIPPQWRSVIDRLELHGVALRRLAEPVDLQVDSYQFKALTWEAQPFEGRHPVRFDLEPITESRRFPAGSAVVDMGQPAARVAAHILEPRAPDSYVYWGFFDAVFEQKEYAESYVMEKMAREMLAGDPDIKREFEKRKSEDGRFIHDARGILNWFYQRSPYGDARMNVYPVGRIIDRSMLKSLPE
jgi:hypothetical protein